VSCRRSCDASKCKHGTPRPRVANRAAPTTRCSNRDSPCRSRGRISVSTRGGDSTTAHSTPVASVKDRRIMEMVPITSSSPSSVADRIPPRVVRVRQRVPSTVAAPRKISRQPLTPIDKQRFVRRLGVATGIRRLLPRNLRWRCERTSHERWVAVARIAAHRLDAGRGKLGPAPMPRPRTSPPR